jgi:phage terminase small subunit
MGQAGKHLPPEDRPLTAKQQAFVDEYLIDFNGTRAALTAGYSAKTAKDIASQNLTKLNIQKALNKAKAERSERTKVTQDQVLAELEKIGFSDIRKTARWGRSPIDEKSKNADPNGLGLYPVELIPSEEIDDDTAAAVSEISLTQNGIKIKMYDKQTALLHIGKHLGMFPTKLEHTNPDGSLTPNPTQVVLVAKVADDDSSD